MLILAVVLFLVDFVAGQVIFLGKCPNVTAMQNFEAPKYLGKWYEAERYFAIFEFGGECVTATYLLNDKGSITVINSQISAITRIPASINGEATFEESPDIAKLSVVFPSLPVRFAAPYWVLETDYENYAVVWSCVQFGFLNSRNAWILTKAQYPTAATLDEAYAVFDKENLTRSLLIKTNQKNCKNNN